MPGTSVESTQPVVYIHTCICHTASSVYTYREKERERGREEGREGERKGQRRREKGREREREREKEKGGDRKRGRERERGREKGREKKDREGDKNIAARLAGLVMYKPLMCSDLCVYSLGVFYMYVCKVHIKS